jgi:hypothetical protein
MMKSMLEGLDFKRLEIEVGDSKDVIPIIQALSEHDLKLRTALVAALAVIDAENDYDEFAKSKGGIRASKRLLDANRELETALEPFKVAGDDAKEPTK